MLLRAGRLMRSSAASGTRTWSSYAGTTMTRCILALEADARTSGRSPTGSSTISVSCLKWPLSWKPLIRAHQEVPVLAVPALHMPEQGLAPL